MHSTPASVGTDPGVALLAEFRARLAALDQGVDDAVRIDRIRLLEQLRGAVAAAQARESAAFAASQRAAQRAVGVPAGRVGRGIAAQLGLARRVSPFQAARYLGWAAVLTSELPATFTALQAGAVGEWPAMVVARETAWLSRDHRTRVDAELAPRFRGGGRGGSRGRPRSWPTTSTRTATWIACARRKGSGGSGCARPRTP